MERGASAAGAEALGAAEAAGLASIETAARGAARATVASAGAAGGTAAARAVEGSGTTAPEGTGVGVGAEATIGRAGGCSPPPRRGRSRSWAWWLPGSRRAGRRQRQRRRQRRAAGPGPGRVRRNRRSGRAGGVASSRGGLGAVPGGASRGAAAPITGRPGPSYRTLRWRPMRRADLRRLAGSAGGAFALPWLAAPTGGTGTPAQSGRGGCPFAARSSAVGGKPKPKSKPGVGGRAPAGGNRS